MENVFIANEFRRSPGKAWPFLGAFLFFISLNFLLIQERSLPRAILACIFFFTAIPFLILFMRWLISPYIQITSDTITLFPLVFWLQPRSFLLDQIAEVHIDSRSAELTFVDTDGQPVRIPLRSMKDKDRIRFIFLFESDFNRKRTVQAER